MFTSKVMTRRDFLRVSAVAALGSAVAACAPAAAPAAPAQGEAAAGEAPSAQPGELSGTIVLISFWDISTVSGWDGFYKKYKEERPKVEVSVQATGWNEYIPKVLSMIAAGTPPDVIGLENGTQLAQMIKEQQILDVKPLMDKSAEFTPQDFAPRLMARATRGDSIFGIPYDMQPVSNLFYVPSIFQDAGVPEPTEEWKWVDALDAAKKLTKSENGKTSVYGWQADWTYFLFTNGGKWADDEFNPTKCTLAQPEAKEAMQFCVDLMHKDNVMPSPQAVQGSGVGVTDLFNTGKIAMYIDGYWKAVENPDRWQELKVGLKMAPAGPKGQRTYGTGGTYFSIPKTSKNVEVAWDFMTHWLGMDGHQAAYEAAPAAGASYPPANLPAYKWWVEKGCYLQNCDIPGKVANDVIFPPASPWWPEVQSTVLQPGIDLILRADKPVDYLDELVAQADTMIADLRQKAGEA